MPAHNDYRDIWIERGYKPDMGSAIACLPPQNADVIRVYHLTTAEYAISNIALGRLKVARFSDLNDPFELLGLNMRERSVQKSTRDFKDAYNAHTGLLCFSEDWAEPVMWSHYGMKHQGICLGFNVPRKNLEKVEYENDRIRAQLGTNKDSVDVPSSFKFSMLKTKSSGWSYEVEQRQFVVLTDASLEGDLHFFPFGKELELAEVILGPLCKLSLHKIRDLTTSRYPSAVTFGTRLAHESYKVVPEATSIP